MKLLALPLMFVLLLVSGCTTTSVDAQIERSLPKICQNASLLYAAYSVAVLQGRVSQKTQYRVDTAYASLQPLCDNPKGQNTVTVLSQALILFATMTTAMKDVKT